MRIKDKIPILRIMLWGTILIWVTNGCDLLAPEEEKDEVEEAVFIANFTEDWLPADAGEGFIVISDLQGQALASATWSGNDQLQFDLELEKGDEPARIIVTTGVRGSYYGDVYMTSNCYVLPGEWTWRGKPPELEYEGYATLQFINESVEGGWYRVSGQGYSITQEKPYQDAIFSLYASEDDLCLIQYPDLSEVSYLWIENLHPGDVRTVDLATLAMANTAEVMMPATEHFYCHFRGYHTPGEYYCGSFYLDSHESVEGDGLQSSVGVAYAVETTDIRTRIVHFDSPDHWDGDYWSFTRYGAVPSHTSKISSDFTIESPLADEFQIDITGMVDNVASYWSGRYEYSGVSWSVYTHPDYTSFALPAMPDNIVEDYGLPPYAIQYVLDGVQIMDYPDLENHDEVIETLFQSDDYFFNIASSGVLSRTRQNSGLAKGIRRSQGEPEYHRRGDPMIPIP